MKIIDIRDVDILSCEDEVFKIKTSSKTHEMKTFKSFYSLEEIVEDLYGYCKSEILDKEYYDEWHECCDKAREKLKKEGLNEDDDEDLFYEYADELWEEYTYKYVEELYEKSKDIVFCSKRNNKDIKLLSDLEDDFRKPKSEEFVFELFYNIEDYAKYLENLDSVGTVECCFYEDTIPFTEEEVNSALHERGVWKTSWQWLAQDKKKVKDNSKPEERYNWLYDRGTDSFEKAKKPFCYYSEYDTVEVSEEEYQELKDKYISRFGGWEKINLEHTDYDGRKWY